MVEFDELDFLKNYRGMEKFVTEEREYYKLFLDLLQNDALLEMIKFANDVLCIPPIKTFIIYEREFLKKNVFNKEMSATAKRGLGACFGYLYKFIYKGYDSEQSWFNDCDEHKQKTGIKTASYFIKRG